MFITRCFGEPTLSPDYPIAAFVQDVQEVLFYIVPFVTCVLLWKLFVTARINPPGNVTVLGLDASASHPGPKER